jgi:putative secretion ATPase (PEP-CTERM system associated)
MAYLNYGLSEREGFIVITGDIGAGKTTLVGQLLSQLDRDKHISATVVTSQLEGDDALRMVASAFGLPFQGLDKASVLRAIESFLRESRRAGKHVLLIVDEVQNMRVSALEELRMLSNFQQDNKPLLQCFLVGQPEFRRIMARPEMEQLRQRVIASCHLEPLDEDETRAYIEHRLMTVGWCGDPDITPEAFRTIYRYSCGVPRRINTLCGRLLLFGSIEERHVVDVETVLEVVQELNDEGTYMLPNEPEPLPVPHPQPRTVAPPPQPAASAPRPASPQPAAEAPPPPPPLPETPVPDAPLPDNRPGKQPYDEVLDDLAARVAILKGRI